MPENAIAIWGGSPAPSPVSATVMETPPNEGELSNMETDIFLSIPAEMWNKVEEKLTLWLDNELSLCQAERGAMIQKFARWRLAYMAPLPAGPKNFPIHNASNLTIPLIKETVHIIAAQLAQSVTTARPRWILKDMAAEWEPFQALVEIFMDLASDRDLKLSPALTHAIVETAILGTSILEVPYEVDERRVYRYTPNGRGVYPKLIVRQDGPRARHIPLSSFWIRMHEKELSDARWFAKRLLLSDQELFEREAQGKFVGAQRIHDFYQDAQEDEDRKVENEARDQRPIRPNRYEIFEVFCAFDVDGDKRMEELRLYYHRDSRTFCGRQFLPYWSGKRNFVKIGYFPHPDRFYDEGLAEMLEQMQIAVSAVANRRADNATLANLKMIIKRKIMKNLNPGDPLYSGKIIEANDIWNDVREFSLSEIYPSTVNEEQILRQVADRLSGVSEASAGSAMPVSRTTAAAQLALLQEQRNRLGLTASSIQEAVKEIGIISTEHYHQFGVNGKAIAWMGDKGKAVEAVFNLSHRVFEMGIGLQVMTPSSSANRQVKRENAIGMFNLLTQMYERILPLAQGLAPDALSEVARAMVKSARQFMEDTLETFEQTNADDVLEGLTVLERLLPAPEDLGGLEISRRREESTALLTRIAGLEDLLRQAEGARDGSLGTPPGNERPRGITPQERGGGGPPSRIFPGGDSLFRS